MFGERWQLSQATPQFHMERMLHKWTPIARFKSQRNERRVYEDWFLRFGGRDDHQQTLAILASDSAITIVRDFAHLSKWSWTCSHKKVFEVDKSKSNIRTQCCAGIPRREMMLKRTSDRRSCAITGNSRAWAAALATIELFKGCTLQRTPSFSNPFRLSWV